MVGNYKGKNIELCRLFSPLNNKSINVLIFNVICNLHHRCPWSTHITSLNSTMHTTTIFKSVVCVVLVILYIFLFGFESLRDGIWKTSGLIPDSFHLLSWIFGFFTGPLNKKKGTNFQNRVHRGAFLNKRLPYRKYCKKEVVIKRSVVSPDYMYPPGYI